MNFNLKYLIIVAIAIVLGAIPLLLPEREAYSKELRPKELLYKANLGNHYMSTDKVAHLLVQGDPSLILVDVRSAEEFAEFHLPRSINLPLDSMLTKTADGYFSAPGVNYVLYSNGSVYANQAWTLRKRLGAKNIYVMEGGLNHWVETIMRPKKPHQKEGEEALALYRFRKAASMFFGGGDAAAGGGGEVEAPGLPEGGGKKTKRVQGGC